MITCETKREREVFEQIVSPEGLPPHKKPTLVTRGCLAASGNTYSMEGKYPYPSGGKVSIPPPREQLPVGMTALAG